MAVRGDAVVFLARLLHWIHVDYSRVEVAQVVEELVVDPARYGVSFHYR